MLNKAMKMGIYVEITTKWPINPDFSSQRWCRIKQIDIINNGQYICKSKKDYFNSGKSKPRATRQLSKVLKIKKFKSSMISLNIAVAILFALRHGRK